MKRFVVRMNAEYSLAVDADSDSAALEKAEAVPIEEWQVAWSEVEAEMEPEVCDECRSYGPQSNCDCRR